MNKNIQKAIDVVKKGKYKRVVVAISLTDKPIVRKIVKDYIDGGFSNADGWRENASSEKDIDYINFLVFNRDSNDEILMFRQQSKYNVQDDDHFFPDGTFFEVERGVKKKLEL